MPLENLNEQEHQHAWTNPVDRGSFFKHGTRDCWIDEDGNCRISISIRCRTTCSASLFVLIHPQVASSCLFPVGKVSGDVKQLYYGPDTIDTRLVPVVVGCCCRCWHCWYRIGCCWCGCCSNDRAREGWSMSLASPNDRLQCGSVKNMGVSGIVALSSSSSTVYQWHIFFREVFLTRDQE